MLSVAILFTACGESRPDDLPVTLNASAEQSYELVASVNNPQSPSKTFNLDDFSGVIQYKKWISSTEVTSTSYIEITGIAEIKIYSGYYDDQSECKNDYTDEYPFLFQ